jgi:hypothetical protein
MEEYLAVRETFSKKVIFMIPYFQGGIGDIIKFFLFLIELCIKKHIKIYFAVTTLKVNRWLRMKYPELYYNLITGNVLQNIYQLDTLHDNIDYIVQPHLLYSTFSYEQLYLKGSDVFVFAPEIIERSKIFPLETYTSIHIRLGDKFLEIPMELNQCVTDVRMFNTDSVVDCIQKNPGILVFCDNLAYKKSLKEKYHIELTPFKIGHTCLPSTSDDIIMDTLTEFYILAKSQHIFISNDSGFPKMAANFYGISFTQLKN